MNIADQLVPLRAEIDAALDRALPTPEGGAGTLGLSEFNEAMRHAVKAGGKRVRPLLTLLCAQACGATPEQWEDALHAATAIELLHSYTLVHDDLPAMDNDTERRGAPTVWTKYSEGSAILVGDCLQALAFQQIAACRTAGKLLPLFTEAATQVIYGQVADITAAKVDPATWDTALLGYVFLNKTAMLIRIACGMGAVAAGADPQHGAALMDYGTHVGLAFQYLDDLLDAQQSETGNELNALAVYGQEAEAVKTTADYCTRKALEALQSLPGNTESLAAFAQFLLNRTI